MREIKFRAWESKQNRMDYNPYGDEMICEGTPINLLFSSPMDGQILMQYTGVKDKNDQEIYEGDIIDIYRRSGGDFYPDRTKRRAIVWTEYNRCVGYNLRPTDNNENSYWVVIGNIYENPNLLERSNS